jgi:hypothetical protein
MHANVIFNQPNKGNIQKEICDLLKSAKTSIILAVAWLTDEDMIRVLAQRAEDKLDVKVVICNSKENFKNTSKFRELLRNGGKLFVTTSPFMHHKFCVIDNNLIINGSYNWSYTAKNSEENILILTANQEHADDALLLKKFVVKHTFLAEKCSVAVLNMDILNNLKTEMPIMGALLSGMDEAEIQKRKDFEEAVIFNIEESRNIKIQLDYTKLLERIRRDGGGVNFVKRLLHEEMQTGDMKSGFRKLEEKEPHRVDLSLEYLVAQSRFEALFTLDEVNFCRELMKKYHFTF